MPLRATTFRCTAPAHARTSPPLALSGCGILAIWVVDGAMQPGEVFVEAHLHIVDHVLNDRGLRSLSLPHRARRHRTRPAKRAAHFVLQDGGVLRHGFAIDVYMGHFMTHHHIELTTAARVFAGDMHDVVLQAEADFDAHDADARRGAHGLSLIEDLHPAVDVDAGHAQHLEARPGQSVRPRPDVDLCQAFRRHHTRTRIRHTHRYGRFAHPAARRLSLGNGGNQRQCKPEGRLRYPCFGLHETSLSHVPKKESGQSHGSSKPPKPCYNTRPKPFDPRSMPIHRGDRPCMSRS